MSAKMSVNRTVFVGCMVAIVSIFAATAWASTAPRPSSRFVATQEPAQHGRLHLEVTALQHELIGKLTVSSKDGQPWTDGHGLAYLLDSSGQRLATIPLQPLAPGEFQLIIPLGNLSGPGYLDVHLTGAEAIGVPRAVYRLDPAGPTLTEVAGLPLDREPADIPSFVQATGGPDAFGYTWNDAVANNWVTLDSPTNVSQRDDDYVGPLGIGFTFKFYGKSYTQFYIDSNGFLSFADNGRSYYTYSKFSLPIPSRPNNIVAPFWEDFNPDSTQGGGGTIRYQAMGTAPNRLLVVEWQNVPLYGETTGQNVQVVLYETSNKIQFNYPNTRAGTRGDLGYSTVGIENDDGSIGLLYPFTITVNVAKTVEFTLVQPTCNVFLTPDQQGNSGTAGTSVTLRVFVKNLGASLDSYTMSRSAYTGSDWAVSFYRSDGVTPLPGNSVGPIATGSQEEVVVKVAVPGGASVGNWTRATVRATSQANGAVQDTATVDVTFAPSFYQIYTDNDSGDGTEDWETYVDPVVNGQSYTRRLTTDQNKSDNPAMAAMPDGNAVVAWNTNYFNGTASVSEIEYAFVNSSGSFVRAITRLTNNSAATYNTFDFAPSVAVAPNGNILIDWALQEDTIPGGSLDRYNARYTIVNSSGGVVKPPTALTNNPTNGPKDYPPSVVALTGTTNFLLAWEHAEPSAVDVYYAVLDSNGNVVRSATRLTGGAGVNGVPRVAALPNGKGAIVWTSYNASGNGEIYYAVVNADGSSPSALTPITLNGSGASGINADAAALSDGQLAVAWTQVTATAMQIQYTVVTGNPASSGISGWVTSNGSGVGGLTLNLIKGDGASESRYMTTTTQANGSYLFTGAASLTSGQYYYVRYLNSASGGNTPNPSCVAYWFGPTISSYTAGTNASGGDFDIVNVSLVSPPNNSSRTLPTDFAWTPRGIAGDNYRWAVMDLSTSAQCLGPYQVTGDFTLDSTGFSNCGLSYGTRYGWFVYVVTGTTMDSFGASYYYRTITFTAGINSVESVVSQDQPVNMLALDGLEETHKTRRPAVDAVQSPAAPQAIYTIPNALSNFNNNVSLVVDQNDRLIMTWLDNAYAYRLFYALADKTGATLTPATILQRTRRSFLWSSWNGYGNAYMPPPATQGPQKVYLPVVLKDYPPPPENIVLNPGFESGLTHWTLAGSDQLAPAPIGSPVHLGGGAAVLGWMTAPCRSDPHGDSSLSQDVPVPSSGAPTLSLWYRILSYDRLVGDKYDWFGVYINGALVWYTGRISSTPVASCAPTPADTGWQQFVYDLSAYAGQTVQLRLVNHTSNDWYNTWTYVDDVSVTQ